MLGEVTNQYAGIWPDNPRWNRTGRWRKTSTCRSAFTVTRDRRAPSTWERPATAARMPSALAIEDVLVKPRSRASNHARRLPDGLRPADRPLRSPAGLRRRWDHRPQSTASRVYRYLQAIADDDSPTVSCLGQIRWSGRERSSARLPSSRRRRSCRNSRSATSSTTTPRISLISARKSLYGTLCSESGPGMSLALTYPIRIAVMYLGRAS